MMERRSFLRGSGACAATAAFQAAARADERAGLKVLAQDRGLNYGCAVRERALSASPSLREAVRREAAMIVAEVEMKWRPTAPSPDRTNYESADALLAFAAGNGLWMRGHTLVWHQNPPAWATPLLAGKRGEDLVFAHIRDIVGRYRGRVREWDVVNEAIQVKDGRPGGLRNWGPYERGYDFIADCFRVAHESDPGAMLCYNDFGLEYDRADQAAKRAATLRLLEELLRRDAPVHGLGIQSHLIAWFPFDARVFRTFLADVADLGLRIRLTELDLNEQKVGGDVARRDRFGAEVVRRYLDAALDEKALTSVLTWGLSDAANWLSDYAPRPDGLPQRSMPLDERFNRKPLWYAMANAFENAPER